MQRCPLLSKAEMPPRRPTGLRWSSLRCLREHFPAFRPPSVSSTAMRVAEAAVCLGSRPAKSSGSHAACAARVPQAPPRRAAAGRPITPSIRPLERACSLWRKRPTLVSAPRSSPRNSPNAMSSQSAARRCGSGLSQHSCIAHGGAVTNHDRCASVHRVLRELVIEAVRRAIDSAATATEVARSIGIDPSLLYGWIRQLKAKEKEAFRGNGKLTAQNEEIRRLPRQLADVTEERHIIKKWQFGSRSNRGEVRLYSRAHRRVAGAPDVPRAQCLAIGILFVASAAAERASDARGRAPLEDRYPPSQESRPFWWSTNRVRSP